MQEIYMVKEGCGTHIVYDQGECERHKKMGWELAPKDFHEKVAAKGKETRMRILKEQQAAAAAQIAQMEEDDAPKRKVKAA